MTTFVALSGGLDSAVVACGARAYGQTVQGVGFRYGQRHVKELGHAQAVADWLDIPLQVVDLPTLQSPALTGDKPVPHAEYDGDSITDTVVQGRNLLFASLIVALAQPHDVVMLGVHSGDHTIYPDCRPDFIQPLADAVWNAYRVWLLAPSLHRSKADIVRRGAALGAPFHLTWSCYEGGDVHCGHCATCRERRAAFRQADVPDPTVYAS